MTLEEAQDKILEQKEKIEELTNNYNSLKTTYDELKTNSLNKESELNDRILGLQEHAQKLFLQLTQEETINKKQDEKQSDLSLDDILQDFRR